MLKLTSEPLRSNLMRAGPRLGLHVVSASAHPEKARPRHAAGWLEVRSAPRPAPRLGCRSSHRALPLRPDDPTSELEKARAVCATQGLKYFVLQVLNDRQQGRTNALALGRQRKLSRPAVLFADHATDPALLLQSIDDTADGGPIVGDHFRDARLINPRVGMNRVKGCKLNGRQVEARTLGALGEDLRGVLVQSTYQVSGHVE